MSRNYKRDERDWRREQPFYREGDQWSASRSDDDFSMGLGGQESHGSHTGDYNRRDEESAGRSPGREGTRRTPSSFAREESGRRQRVGGTQGSRADDFYGPEDRRRGEMDWDQRNEGFQNSSRWQRSQFRPSEGDFGGPQRYGPDRDDSWKSWNERFEGLGGRGWYEGVQNAMHREEGQFTGRGPRNYKRSDERIEEDINERLTRHGMVDATEIEVSVQNGEVTLRGSVDNRKAKRIAEDIADAVSGVREVTNQVKVKQQGESNERSDKQETGKQRKAS